MIDLFKPCRGFECLDIGLHETEALIRGAMFPSHMVINHVGNGSNILVRREVALEVGGFEPSYWHDGIGGCEDRDFQLRVLKHYRMEIVREFLVGYRVYPGNMSSNRYAMGFGSIAVVENFLDDDRLAETVKRKALASAYAYAFLRLVRTGSPSTLWQLFVKGNTSHAPVFWFFVRTRLQDYVRKLFRKTTGIGRPPKPIPGKPQGNFYDFDPKEGVDSAKPRTEKLQRSLDRQDRNFELQLSQAQ